MSKKSSIWFNCKCPHCEHRNKHTFTSGQFELPNRYEIKWSCDMCGKKSIIVFDFAVHGCWEKKKAPKLRKRRKDEKKRKKEAEAESDRDTQRNGGYRNDSAKQKV